MIDWTKPHNWIGLALAILVIGFLWHQVAARVAPAQTVVKAAFGS